VSTPGVYLSQSGRYHRHTTAQLPKRRRPRGHDRKAGLRRRVGSLGIGLSSGAYTNPAVTEAFALTRHSPWALVGRRETSGLA
jgi:hypothetical protein